MSVDAKKTCSMHTKEKEKSGTCCQIKEEQERAEQRTYEHSIETKEQKFRHGFGFTVKDEVPTDWKVQTSTWNVEDSSKWKTEDSDSYFYNIEEIKDD